MQFFSNALVAGLLLRKIPATWGHLDTPFGLADLVHVRRLPYYLDIQEPHESISSLAPTTESRSEGALVKGAFSKLSFLLSPTSSWFCCILRQEVWCRNVLLVSGHLGLLLLLKLAVLWSPITHRHRGLHFAAHTEEMRGDVVFVATTQLQQNLCRDAPNVPSNRDLLPSPFLSLVWIEQQSGWVSKLLKTYCILFSENILCLPAPARMLQAPALASVTETRPGGVGCDCHKDG